MRIVMTSLAVLALMACNKPAETTTENVAEENMAMDANAMDANAMATPAASEGVLYFRTSNRLIAVK